MTPETSYFIFPEFDPVALALGPIVIRWYALAYIFGILIGWRYMLHLAKKPPAIVKPNHCEDMITWATLGTIIGGRLGQALCVWTGTGIQRGCRRRQHLGGREHAPRIGQ